MRTMHKSKTRLKSNSGFTLVELLVVLFIVGLVSAATLPIIIPTLNQRQVQEGSRIVQQALINARFAAMSTGRPAGIRLLPDPILFGPDPNDFYRPLVYNRMVQLEPAPDYSDGQVRIHSGGASGQAMLDFFKAAGDNWANQLNGFGGIALKNSPQYNNLIAIIDPRIVVSQFKDLNTYSEPTNWSWNIKAGDRMTLGVSNTNQYVIAGPAFSNSYPNLEKFINFQNPEYTAKFILLPTKIDTLSGQTVQDHPSEILYLVNEGNRSFDNIDNNNDGVADPAFNGKDDDENGVIDNSAEMFWSRNADPVKSIVRPMFNAGAKDADIIEALQNTFEWDPVSIGSSRLGTSRLLGVGSKSEALEYNIKRRMVPSANSAEVGLPSDVVIDATTAVVYLPCSKSLTLTEPNIQKLGLNQIGPSCQSDLLFLNSSSERSRLPIDLSTGYVDIIFQPDGQVTTSGASSVNNPPFQVPFYHLWLTDRGDVFPPTDPFKSKGKLYNPRLPISVEMLNTLQSQHMNLENSEWALKNERRLITIQTRTGKISSQSVEQFDPNQVDLPYQDAQKGIAEAGQ